jgi:hypothetical protein
MNNKFHYIACLTVTLLFSTLMRAQDSLITMPYNDSQRVVVYKNYDPHGNKIIPDKVFEFGVPLLLIFMVLNTIVTIFKMRSEAALKEKAMDKGISESTLIELFREDKQMVKNTYLKWFLVLAAIGIALIYVHMLHQYVKISSGYFALGLISLLISIAFLIYYRIIRKQR